MLQFPPMMNQKATWQQMSIVYVVAAVVLVLDQASKWWVEATIPGGGVAYPIASIGQYFNFLHAYNTGAAFGTFRGSGWVFSTVAVIVIGFIIYFNTQLPAQARLARWALGLMMGGAAGNNLIDRFRLGHVTDFIHINLRPLVENYPRLDFAILDWPIFNIADMAIVSGVITMVVLMWREEQFAAEQQATLPPPPPPPVYNFAQPGWSQLPAPTTPATAEDTRLARFTLLGVVVWTAALILSLGLALRVLIGRRRR